MSKLWAIFFPGSNTYCAAPSEAAAKHMADWHTAAVLEYVTKSPLDLAHEAAKSKLDWWAHEAVAEEAVEWPFEPEYHAQGLEGFNYAAWGLEGGACRMSQPTPQPAPAPEHKTCLGCGARHPCSPDGTPVGHLPCGH